MVMSLTNIPGLGLDNRLWVQIYQKMGNLRLLRNNLFAEF